MKQLLLFCFACTLLASCKKSSTPFQGYLKMKIDGIQLDYGQKAQATKPRAGNSLQISGYCSNVDYGSFGIELGMAILGETLIKDNNNQTNYNQINFTLFRIGNANYFAGTGGLSGSVSGSGKIIILEISNDYVKGTFDFITGPDAATNIKKTVTNGEFYIKRE